MAPRAAARLESFGFTNVHEYKAGKVDWMAAGLPAEGRWAAEPTVGSVMHRDVPRFGLEDRAGLILERLHAEGSAWAAIVNSKGILLGRVRAGSIREPDQAAAEIMEEGPATYRPNVPIEELLNRMQERHFDQAFVTDPDGRLRGLVKMRDLLHALAARRRAS
jgi:CBS domain-containing protein